MYIKMYLGNVGSTHVYPSFKTKRAGEDTCVYSVFLVHFIVVVCFVCVLFLQFVFLSGKFICGCNFVHVSPKPMCDMPHPGLVAHPKTFSYVGL